MLILCVGLALFLYGFFLTRKELPLTSLHNVRSTATINTTIVTYHSYVQAKPLSQLLSGGSVRRIASLGDVLELNGSAEYASRTAPASRVFLLIVDALRLDFMVDTRKEAPVNSPFDKMAYMHSLLRHNASQTMLFGFRADPPTVTSQRLKSIVTGTLPTFIDIGANLNSSAVTDDNVIDQLLRRGNLNNHQVGECPSSKAGECTDGNGSVRIVVLGDDTWGALFPTQLTETHLFDSFNTRDLDTVDDGIERHLYSYLRGNSGSNSNSISDSDSSDDSSGDSSGDSNSSSDSGPPWDLLVAHFLGLDHIGHTHHAHHPLMAQRLRRVDAVLERVVAALPEDAVLLLFGDHGMTDEGEHGGSSVSETDSGLFVYSKRTMFIATPPTAGAQDDTTTLYWNDHTSSLQLTPVDRIRSHPRMVSQLDLTPTLSLLMGLPIPASNLGKVIPELFLQSGASAPADRSGNMCVDRLADTLFINAIQVSVGWLCGFTRKFAPNLPSVQPDQVWRYLSSYWSASCTSTDIHNDTAGTPQRRRRRHSPAGSSPGSSAEPAFELVADPGTHPSLRRLEDRLLTAVNLHADLLGSPPGTGTACAPTAVVKVQRAYMRFFTETQDFAR
jgi:hypothetical protein